MSILMFPHSGCYNHGCEAIVRSSVGILKEVDSSINLYTTDIESDKKFGLDKICNLIPNISSEVHISNMRKKIFALKERLTGKNRDMSELVYQHKNMVKMLSSDTIALSIGGDNYCYGGMQHVLNEHMKVLQHRKIPCVLWGCSLEKEWLTPRVLEEIKQYEFILGRESLTCEILKEKGVNESKIIECSDPAFLLVRQETHWNDDKMNLNEVIGINVSDLMRHYNAYPEATYKNFYRLLEYLLRETNFYIALIPHVRQAGNDDLAPIQMLAKELDNERILIVSEDYNCMQLKDIIARCRMFIGCRTHSTIAAYSTCVPTLVVGYSVKAKGIARDIFGDYKDLLIDVHDFESDFDLTKKVQSFLEREGELRQHLENVMPAYKAKAYLAKNALLNLK